MSQKKEHKLTYASKEEYCETLSGLVELEADYQEKKIEALDEKDVEVIWSPGNKKFVFATFKLLEKNLPDNLKLKIGNELLLSLDDWEEVGRISDIFYRDLEKIIRLEIKNNLKPPTDCTQNFRVRGVFDSTSYIRQLKAILEFDKQEDNRITDCLLGRSNIVAEITALKDENKKLDLEGRHLNPSQKNAITQSVFSNLSLIQGPPGTGKTETTSHLVNELVKMKMGRLLVCAPSNSATDLLTEKISKFNLEMVRVFSTEGKRKTEGSAIEKFGLHKIIFKRCEKLRKLKQEYDDFEDSNEEEFKELKRKIELQVLRDADVVLTTCVLSGSKLIKSVNFDRVIIDEAGQASEPETLITIMHGMESEKIILIGDHHQLRPTITCEDAEKLGLSVSLFERLVALKATPNFLDTQYRMHPKLAAYLSWMFYDSKLKNGVNCAQRQPTKNYPWNNRLHPIEFRAVWGEESTRGCSKFNKLEANEVKKVVDKLMRAGVGPNQVGVITPYEAQRILLTKILEKSKVEIKNVDGFQGREKDYIIFSCVRSAKQSSIGFVSNPNRLNVAITRAKLGLIMVGNSFILSRKNFWNQMLYQYLDDDAIVNVSQMTYLFEQPRKQKPKEIFATKLHEENQLVKNVQQTRPNKMLKITNLPRFRNRFDTHKFVGFKERLVEKLTEYGELEETNIVRSGVTFLIDTQTGSYSEILRNFPNIETLEFLSNKWSIDTNAVNSLENLRELKFNGMESWLLEQINCPKIHKFSVDGELSFRYSASWCKFFEKHQNIEHIELKARNVCKQYGSHFIQDFKNFPALKTLKNYDKIWSYHVKYIGDNLTSLEHLEVVVNESLVAEAVAYFQAKFPHLGCDSRKLQKRKDGAWDWLVSLRKF